MSAKAWMLKIIKCLTIVNVLGGVSKTKGRGKKSQVLLLTGPLSFFLYQGGVESHCGFGGLSKMVIKDSLHYAIPLDQ